MTRIATAPLAEIISARLTQALAPSRLEVSNDSHLHAGHAGHDGSGESHFSVSVESAAFAGLNRVARQRLVNRALADLLATRIHALAIRASAPGRGMTYKLWYWPGIQGAASSVRLPLEAAGIEYIDAARLEGVEAMLANMGSYTRPPFAPPYLELDGLAIAQVANILAWLGSKHDLAPSNLADRYWCHEVQLTIADLVAEVHDVHHPVANGAFYEDQQAEAARAAEQFRNERLPKFLDWLARAADCNDGEWLIDGRWTYVDTSIFQLWEGLGYMFPQRMRTLAPGYAGLQRIHGLVAELPGIRAYLRSERRLPFNTQGIFRYYPELDAA